MLIKIHEASRIVVALCDKEIFGKIFSDEKRELNLNTTFFDGEEKDTNEIKKMLLFYKKEDASFNIVGEKSCSAAIEVGLIKKEDLCFVNGVPFCLILL